MPGLDKLLTRLAPRFKGMTDEAIEAFTKLGSAQRGAPEMQMLRVQSEAGGGVLNPIVEHVGDLTHRMSHMAPYDNMGGEFVRDKTAKTLRGLEHPYGFEKEMGENIESNSRYTLNRELEQGRSPDKDWLTANSPEARTERIAQELTRYADEHSKLPAWNRPQFLAREAAVAVGKQDWTRAKKMLNALDTLANSPEYEHAARLKSPKAYAAAPLALLGDE